MLRKDTIEAIDLKFVRVLDAAKDFGILMAVGTVEDIEKAKIVLTNREIEFYTFLHSVAKDA